MKLTDQEQVILKAIDRVGRSGLASIAAVVKAVGYPKATTKKVLIGLSNKGVVSLHRHDWPQSLTPAQRKLMLRLKDGRGIWSYYNAVSMRKRNPKSKGRTALKKTGRALKGAARGALSAASQILGAGAEALNPTRKRHVAPLARWEIYRKLSGKGEDVLAVVSATSRTDALKQFHASYPVKSREASLKHWTLHTRRFGAIRFDNPARRKVRNKYIDLVIKGQAKKTPQGWQVGKKTFAQGRGTVSVSSGYYLDKHTGMVYAKRERNVAKRKRRNVEQGFYDASGFHPIRASSDYSEGQRPSRSKKAKASKRKAKATASHKRRVSSRKATTRRLASRVIKKTVKSRRRRNVAQGFYDSSGFHPIRASADYDPAIAGETGRKAKTTRSRKKLASKRKASQTARRKRLVAGRKATTKRLAGKAIKKSSGLLKKRGRKNPSAEKIRKMFSGRVSGERDVFVPGATPKGKLAKLGKLISITTEEGTIKPVHGSAVLLADTNGKLHIGSLTNAPLFNGPARSFGQVKRIEYDDSKPHLGFKSPIIWHHKMGEETGHRPTLHADGKGGLVFRGGRYRLTARGIEN